MTEGTVFDIKEFAVQDGPGIRTTVFLKGCPLRCLWCHNPEGLRMEPEVSILTKGCRDCGLCRRGCGHPECQPFGRCLHICPNNLLKRVGERITPEALAQRLENYRPIMRASGGGVTFSGGEPLLQAQFLLEVIALLPGLHTIVETSGYADAATFEAVAGACDEIYLDIKHMDDGIHRQLTGVSNLPIQRNLDTLIRLGKPFTVRIPLIPGCNDDPENLEWTARRLQGAQNLRMVELLPYNTMAGAKYPNFGRTFSYVSPAQKQDFTSPEAIFRRYSIPHRILSKESTPQH